MDAATSVVPRAERFHLPGWRSVLTALLAALALAGVAVAGYLAIENSQGQHGVCTITHGCARVQESKYGKILGVPVSVPGLALYVALAAAAVVAMTNFRGWRPYATIAGAYGAFFGVLFSAYLTYLEAFVIDAWCIYCITSALLLTALFAGWAVLLGTEVRARRR